MSHKRKKKRSFMLMIWEDAYKGKWRMPICEIYPCRLNSTFFPFPLLFPNVAQGSDDFTRAVFLSWFPAHWPIAIFWKHHLLSVPGDPANELHCWLSHLSATRPCYRVPTNSCLRGGQEGKTRDGYKEEVLYLLQLPYKFPALILTLISTT